MVLFLSSVSEKQGGVRMSYELSGAVKVVGDLQTFDSGFTKREVVVTTDGKYPQDVKFECMKDKTALLDGVSVGEQVTVKFDVRGNEYNGKYYVSLTAWNVSSTAEGTGADGRPIPKESPVDEMVPAAKVGGDADDSDTNVPF
jgi:single-strand DNA-binding protein